MSLGHRLLTTLMATVSVLLLAASAAFAGHCTVVDKEPDAGVQILFDETSGEADISQGVQNRAEASGYDLTKPADQQAFLLTEFHGWFGVDVNGDGEANFSILFPGNTEDEGDFEIPQLPGESYENGPECHGTVHVEDYIDCLAAQ